MAHYTDLQERGHYQLTASRILDSMCKMARFLRMMHRESSTSQALPILCPSIEEARYIQWTIESAFEDGFSQFVQAAESDGLQAAAALTIQTYCGTNREVGGELLPFPSGKAIQAVLASTESVFHHEVRVSSWQTLRLTMQRYTEVDPLVKAVLREGQRIDMTEYITATLRYYEQHGSPCMDLEQREAFIRNSFPISITPREQCVAFVLIGHDKRGRYRLGTNTRMFQEELAGVEKFGPPYYRLRTTFLSAEQEAGRHVEHLRETLEEIPLFHAGVVVAVGKAGV